MTRNQVGALVAVVLSTILTATSGVQGRNDDRRDDDEREAYAIGLWGDLPYSPLQATVGVPNLIADMNRQELAFTAHDGDLRRAPGVMRRCAVARRSAPSTR